VLTTTDTEPPRLRNAHALDAAVAELDTRAAARVVALIPAHNEQGGIAYALDSMDRQTHQPDLVVVIADNCTDETERIVGERGGAIVVSTVANAHKKAGALNLVMERLLPCLQPADGVMVVDADSALDAGFVEAALHQLGTRACDGSGKTIGGVGGTFRGGRGGGFVGMMQRNEYARYARDVRRLKGKVLVLTGTAAIFSVAALRRVVQARAFDVIPGDCGQVYDTNVLTEDNELTLALLHLGYAVISPRECLLETEIMTTWSDLWKQRVRWKRGALENLMEYGLTPVTWRYWVRQLLTHAGVLVTSAYLLTILLSIALTGGLHIHPVWLVISGVFVAERVISVRERGPLQMALASVIVVEMTFEMFLQAAQARAFWQTVRHTERRW
jgi:cellulose synthase/poly-beta-1,6-N-acetylglucosamine synthase-like glycosyltransferase